MRNGELYRYIADTRGAFAQPALYEGARCGIRGWRAACLLLLALAFGGALLHKTLWSNWQCGVPSTPCEAAAPLMNLCLCRCVTYSVPPTAFGLTVIEAMTCGLPTFATNHGGPSEIIKHKKSGE